MRRRWHRSLRKGREFGCGGGNGGGVEKGAGVRGCGGGDGEEEDEADEEALA